MNFIREDVVKIRSGKYLLLSPGGDIMGVFDTRHAAVKRQQELDFYTHESVVIEEFSYTRVNATNQI